MTVPLQLNLPPHSAKLQSYRRMLSTTNTLRSRLWSAADIIGQRPLRRALVSRALSGWAAQCETRRVRVEAWSICAAAEARSTLSESGRVRAVAAWATAGWRLSAARLLGAWAAWAFAARSRRRVGATFFKRRELRILRFVLFCLSRAAVMGRAPVLSTI